MYILVYVHYIVYSIYMTVSLPPSWHESAVALGKGYSCRAPCPWGSAVTRQTTSNFENMAGCVIKYYILLYVSCEICCSLPLHYMKARNWLALWMNSPRMSNYHGNESYLKWVVNPYDLYRTYCNVFTIHMTHTDHLLCCNNSQIRVAVDLRIHLADSFLTWYPKLKKENWANMCSRTFCKTITWGGHDQQVQQSNR